MSVVTPQPSDSEREVLLEGALSASLETAILPMQSCSAA